MSEKLKHLDAYLTGMSNSQIKNDLHALPLNMCTQTVADRIPPLEKLAEKLYSDSHIKLCSSKSVDPAIKLSGFLAPK